MAILILIVGGVIFGVGIIGQVGLARRRRHRTHPQDAQGARIVIGLAAIIVGAWMVIGSIVALLQAHLHSVAR